MPRLPKDTAVCSQRHVSFGLPVCQMSPTTIMPTMMQLLLVLGIILGTGLVAGSLEARSVTANSRESLVSNSSCDADGMFEHWSCARLRTQPLHASPAEVAFRRHIAALCNNQTIAPALTVRVDCKFADAYRRLFDEGTGWAEEAWVTYVGLDSVASTWFDILHTLIQSVQLFSTRPIIVFCVSSKAVCRSIFLLTDRLLVFHVEATPATLEVPFDMHKWKAMLLSRVRVGVQVDVDQIVLPAGDALFKSARAYTTLDYPYPLMAVHWMSRDAHGDEYAEAHAFTFQNTTLNRSMRYNHAHATWTYHALEWLCSYYARALTDMTVRGLTDEELANVLLWEQGATRQMCKWDHILKIAIDDYLDPHRWHNIATQGMYADSKWYPHGTPILMYTFHHTKFPKFTKAAIENIQLTVASKTAEGKWPIIFYNGTPYFSTADFEAAHPHFPCLV